MFGVITPSPKLHLHPREPARIIISAIVGLQMEGEPANRATVELGLVLNRRLITREPASINGGGFVQVPIQALAPVQGGEQELGVARNVQYRGTGAGDVLVGPITITASVLPEP